MVSVSYTHLDVYKRQEDAVLVKCKESRVFLHSIGIEGEILSTPSHSKDSISLILDDGSCFVGDLEPIDYLDAYDNNVELKEDWKIVMSRNSKVIFPKLVDCLEKCLICRHIRRFAD